MPKVITGPINHQLSNALSTLPAARPTGDAGLDRQLRERDSKVCLAAARLAQE